MKKAYKIIIPVIIVVVLAVVIVAIMQHKSTNSASSTSSNSSAASSATETNSVTVENFAFNPITIKVKLGTTVTWTNKDPVHHTVTGDDSTINLSSNLIGQGETYSYTFNKVGSFTYHCTPHPYMHGTVIVTQ